MSEDGSVSSLNLRGFRLDRDKDVGEVSSILGGDLSSQPPKRPRINRNRYHAPHGVAKRTLPIDPQAGDKSRTMRKD